MCFRSALAMSIRPFAPRHTLHYALSVSGLCLLALAACKRSDSPAASAAKAPPPATAASAAVRVDPARARGKWLRPDGGYILEIGTIADDGRAEAGYFNPNPIRVAWARVKAEGGVLKVDVELRDENYPGCLYKLSYVPEKDRLVGTYLQAQLQETYEVEFVRTP